MLNKITISIVSAALLASCGNDETTKDSATVQSDDTVKPVNWRMTSTFPSSMVLLGSLGKRLEKTITLATSGSVNVKFYEPSVLAPAFESFDAVSYGAIEAAWSTSGYWAGKVPALQLFSAVPFGPSAPEYLAWYDYGGGRELFQEIYHAHNIHGIICGMTPPESSGWFKEEIKTLDDFKGKKIRFFGLGGKVLEKVGASPQLLAGGDIFPALERGTIDGTEYSMPAVDLKMGFHQIAKHYYFPGWHQQSTMFELIINLENWNSLNETQQKQIDLACSSNIHRGISLGEALQFEALQEIEAKGVTIHTWSPEVLAGLKKAWDEVAVDLAKDDADFARVWASLQDFRKKYKIWSDRGYIKD